MKQNKMALRMKIYHSPNEFKICNLGNGNTYFDNYALSTVDLMMRVV